MDGDVPRDADVYIFNDLADLKVGEEGYRPLVDMFLLD